MPSSTASARAASWARSRRAARFDLNFVRRLDAFADGLCARGFVSNLDTAPRRLAHTGLTSPGKTCSKTGCNPPHFGDKRSPKNTAATHARTTRTVNPFIHLPISSIWGMKSPCARPMRSPEHPITNHPGLLTTSSPRKFSTSQSACTCAGLSRVLARARGCFSPLNINVWTRRKVNVNVGAR